MAAGLASLGIDAADFFLPNVISCSAVVSACGIGLLCQQALDTLTVMLQTEVLPNVISYSAGINAFEKGPAMASGLGSFGVDAADCGSA